METDPETGEVKVNDKTKGLQKLESFELIYKVTFPNYQQLDFSSRPYFNHGWYQTMRQHVAASGGCLELDDEGQQFITVVFRNRVAAHRFAKSLVNDYYMSHTRIKGTIEKMAAANDTAALAQRVNGVINDPQVQSALQSAFTLYKSLNPAASNRDLTWLWPALQSNEHVREAVAAAVKEAEERNSGRGGVRFNPKDYYRHKDPIEQLFNPLASK
jgi:hypothetical protein